MMSLFRTCVALGLLLGTTALPVAADESLARTDIAKLGKAATALVEVQGGSASAFCVHPTGLFITNDHVVHGAGVNAIRGARMNTVSLILNAGLPSERVIKAKVIRRDKNLDLALLRVEGESKLPALALGSDDNLTELAEVVAFGFPFGGAMSVEKGAHPTISVNVGSITALRRNKRGALTRIQLDAVLNPGNSGGPVLDRQGKVVGVVVGAVVGRVRGGAGVNLAIPVSHLQRFLARPEILVTPPTVTKANQHQPVEFRARVVSLLPAPTPLELELVLGSRTGEARHVSMKLSDDVYHAEAVPFVGVDEPVVLHLGVKFENGAVTGMVADRRFRVGSETVQLSQVRRLSWNPNPTVQLRDQRQVEGSLADLETLSVKVGKQSLRLDLTGAVLMVVDSPDPGTAVSCSIIARQKGKEVGQTSFPVYLEGAAEASLEAVRDGHFIRPPRSVTPISYLQAVSSKGDYIGQGKSYSYGGEELTLRRSDRGVQISVDGWNILFGAPRGRFLQVGEYRDAKRYPFSNNAPGIEFSGNGRGCNQISGHFTVWELEVKGNEIVRLAIDFTQRCETRMPPLYGKIRFNSTFH